jgi:glycosyltransferase involved in cell wall biosynthesis
VIRKRRVVQVIQNLNYGGMERLLADIVRRADPDRFESHVLVLGYLGRFAEGLDRYARLHVAPKLPPYSLLWPGPLVSLFREIAPDVVHMHSGVWYKASLAARAAGVPRLIFTEHGRVKTERWFPRMLDRRSARRTDVIVAVSEAVARSLRDGIVSQASRLVLVENGVDTSVYRPAPDNGKLRSELGLASDVPILGSVGRLEQIKGYDVMVEALALLRREWHEGPPPVVVIGGDGSERERCAALARERGISDALYLLSWRDDIHDLHAGFTLFTMSSRSEGTSVSLLEAMSAGLCPVVTDVGGNGVVLGEGLRHRMVPSESPALLAQAWQAALGDAAARARDAAAARGRVEEQYSLERMVRRYEELYCES